MNSSPLIDKTPLSEPSHYDMNCILLHKVASLNGLELPDPKVHVYLAGVIQRQNDPSLKESVRKFVVKTERDLDDTVSRYKQDEHPNAMPYLIAKHSGDFGINYGALSDSDKNPFFISSCYSVAQYHSRRMGKIVESRIFGLLALNPEQYILLLARYYELIRNTEIQVTDDDFAAFKEFLRETENRGKRLEPLPKITQKRSNKLLI